MSKMSITVLLNRVSIAHSKDSTIRNKNVLPPGVVQHVTQILQKELHQYVKSYKPRYILIACNTLIILQKACIQGNSIP